MGCGRQSGWRRDRPGSRAICKYRTACTSHVLRQPSKQLFRLSGCQQFLPWHPHREHSSFSSYLLTNSQVFLPSCISRRNAVSHSVSSHFEDLLYNHMAHLQDEGTQIHVPCEGNSLGLQLLCKMSHASHRQDCPATCADRHQRTSNFVPELKTQINVPSFSLFARTAGPSHLCFLSSMQADFLNFFLIACLCIISAFLEVQWRRQSQRSILVYNHMHLVWNCPTRN